MKKIVIAIALCVLCLASCIKDEAKNKECDIESAWIEGEEYEQYFYQKTDMYKDVSSTETNIVFYVRSLISMSTAIPLDFKITSGATVYPASGSLQDFTAMEAHVQCDILGSTVACFKARFRACRDRSGEDDVGRCQ